MRALWHGVDEKWRDVKTWYCCCLIAVLTQAPVLRGSALWPLGLGCFAVLVLSWACRSSLALSPWWSGRILAAPRDARVSHHPRYRLSRRSPA